ncbi:MAG: ABC transporter permease [Cyclobacteriaceae bacterium]|nr:ABC transporter permease [Cyclobacteriaceae bacterium]
MNSLLHPGQLRQLILAYSKELLREPGVLFWGIVFPILMSLGLGIAFTKTQDIERSIAIVSPAGSVTGFLSGMGEKLDPEDGEEAYKIRLRDENLGNTTLFFTPMTWDEAIASLKRGTIGLILEEKNGDKIYHFDPSNTDAQLTYMKVSALFNSRKIETASGEEIQPLTLRGTRYIDFLIPGLIAMNVMTSCLWGLGYGVIDKRSKKLMRRMVATPMKKSHFLFSLITVRFMMNLVESVLLFIFAWIVFDVVIQGNIPALILVFLAGNLAFSGLAVFISSRTANTEIGNGLINAIVFPLMVLSGIFFSYHNFPGWSIPYIQKLPLTLLTDGIRSIFIEGASLNTILFPSFLLVLTGLFFFTIGLKIFRWY